MARSYGVLKPSLWEPGSDFRQLDRGVQWTYEMLISQPQISNLGLLDYTPERWARLAADLTAGQLERDIEELARHGYVILDLDTGELLIRTFVKHDKVWAQPKLVTNCRRLIREVESEPIRSYLVQRHPWLVDNTFDKAQILAWETPSDTPIETPSGTPFQRPPETPIERGFDTHIPPRARAGAGAGVGASLSSTQQSQPKAVTEARPPAHDPETNPTAPDFTQEEPDTYDFTLDDIQPNLRSVS